MALGADIGGVIGSVLNKGGVSAPDLSALFATIKNAGANQRQLIDALPAELKPLWDNYAASNAKAGADLTAGTNAIATGLEAKTAANYGPEAARASEDAAKTAIYANLPAQQNAIRQALASSGGFDRGTAAKQLAAPVLAAGTAVAQNVANVEAQQLQAKQQATQQAINTVAKMNEDALNSLFGMSKEQATAILNGNRSDLKDQLTALINQSVNETNQTLGVQGADVSNKYNASVAEKAQKDAANNAWINLGVDAATAGSNSGLLSGLGIGASTGFNPSTMSTNPVGFRP